MRDRPGLVNYFIFGSAHPSGINMAFCDGSVRHIPFTISQAAHSALGHRSDGRVVPLNF
jgi:prepilin-type processing-associated H-X9-DG protein